jgi:2-polyprenyl-3-methyl-5-hydroxy-6-metoxy-1,4-benzoquinol methylase
MAESISTISTDRPASLPGYIERALQSAGQSANVVHQMAARALAERGLTNVRLADVGCGRGDFYPVIANRCSRYIGIDAVKFDGFPNDIEFVQTDLNAADDALLTGGPVDVTVSLETIEHLENPRAFMRLLTRFTRPGGWIVVTTPNQRSLLSLATLIIKGQFSQFQDVHYPAHLTALLDIDLLRMAREVGLVDVSVDYTRSGRLPLSSRHVPGALSRRFPRLFSDNVMIVGRRPA